VGVSITIKQGKRLIPFVKAHACGNDFLVIQEKLAGAEARDAQARRLCHRNQGIGADGIEFLTLDSPRQGKIRLYNADGSIAEISGNGTRCVAAWMAYESNAGPGDEIALETDAGLRVCRIEDRTGQLFQITSAMGIPSIEAANLPLSGGERAAGSIVSTGNPHFVIFLEEENFHTYPWEAVGEEICNNIAFFPQGTNVEFVRILARDEIEIRIYERGVGPTSSSGTGTSATAAAAIALHGAAHELRVKAPGGTQIVRWQGPGSELHLTGPAELVCFGETW
jgi:diaminopimelate epimerase